MKKLKKLSREELKKVSGAKLLPTDPIGMNCGEMCSSHSDCHATLGSTTCGVCVTSAVGLLGRCTGY